MTTHRKFTTIGAVATLSLSLVGTTAIPAAFAAPATNTTAVAPAANASHTYDDGATITFPSSWDCGAGSKLHRHRVQSQRRLTLGTRPQN